MADARIKNLKIKTNVVKRIMKEKGTYEKELKQNEDRIAKMKSEGRDEYDIKKMGEVMAETRMMVPDCLKRLSNAVDELKNTLDGEIDLKDIEEYKEGTKALAEANALLAEN